MTLSKEDYYGGYERLTIGTDGANASMHQLSPLSKRFIRFIAKRYLDDLVLPRATHLPLTTGGPIFTLWNEGYNNCRLRDYSGIQIACLQGTGTAGVAKCWTHVYLEDNSTGSGVWRIDCNGCTAPPDVTETSTWELTNTAGEDPITEPDTTEATVPTVTMGIKQPLPPKPFPFPRHPEIPIPVPQRKRAAEGI